MIGLPGIPKKAPPFLQSLQFFASIVARHERMFIEADNKEIGLMCFISIGMTEISTR
jgi:phosphatidylserine decarboxylase